MHDINIQFQNCSVSKFVKLLGYLKKKKPLDPG